jgi:hypothetical protein
MNTKGGSGYDADKFEKLVAMFESPSAPEASNAFRLAVLELKKKLAAIDQTTLAVKVQVEYEALRRDLQKELNLTNSGNRSAGIYNAIIEQLYRRISMVEETLSNAPHVDPPQPEPAEDYVHDPPAYEYEMPEDDMHESQVHESHVHESEYVDEAPNPSQKTARPASLDAPHRSTMVADFIGRLYNTRRKKRFGWLWLSLKSSSPTSVTRRTLFPGLKRLSVASSCRFCSLARSYG